MNEVKMSFQTLRSIKIPVISLLELIRQPLLVLAVLNLKPCLQDKRSIQFFMNCLVLPSFGT